MTDAQRCRLYFPAWHRAYRACWERDLTGALVLCEAGLLNDWAVQVEQSARTLAIRSFRVPVEDDLRKACHIVAIGRPCSSKDLTNRQLDRLLILFRLLAEPTDLDAVIAWDRADKPDEKRLRWCVEHCGFEPAYLATLCRDKFGSSRWQSLDLHHLHQLVVTLEQRRRARQRQVAAQPAAVVESPESELEEDPF